MRAAIRLLIFVQKEHHYESIDLWVAFHFHRVINDAFHCDIAIAIAIAKAKAKAKAKAILLVIVIVLVIVRVRVRVRVIK